MTTYAGPPVFPPYFVDNLGDPQGSVSITVYNRGTTVKPTLYTDHTKATPLGNPFTADSFGNAEYYLDPGQYDALVNGVTLPFVVLADPAEPVSEAAIAAAVAGLDLVDQSALDAAISALSGTYGTTPDGNPAVALVTGGPAQTVTKDVSFLGELAVSSGKLLLPSSPKATLPAVGSPGRIARVVDDYRGLWVDGGREWFRVDREINPKWFGGIGDGDSHPLSEFYATLAEAQVDYPHAVAITDELDWAAAQMAVTAAKACDFPEGGWHLQKTLSAVSNVPVGVGPRISGDGRTRTTLFHNLAAQPLLDIDGTGAGNYMHGAELSDFRIETTPAGASGIGIRIRAQWYLVLDSLSIAGLGSDAIRVINEAADLDASYHPSLKNLSLLSNAGWGLNMVTSASQCAVSWLEAKNSRMVGNLAGGARVLGLHTSLDRCGFANNGNVGVLIADAPNGAEHVGILRGSFDGNELAHIRLERGASVLIDAAKFVHAAASGPRYNTPIAVDILNGYSTARVEIRRPRVRRDAGTITAFKAGADVTELSIVDPQFSTTTGVTKYDIAASRWELVEGSTRRLHAVAATALLPSTTPVIYNPNMNDGEYHRVQVLAGGNEVTIGPPTPVRRGLQLMFRIFNNSGGTIAVTFDAVFRTAGYVNPANGRSTTARFFYDDVAGTPRWMQVGAWSPDLTT